MFVHAQSLSHVQIFGTPWTVAHQAALPMKFSRREYWSGLPFLVSVIFPNQWSKPMIKEPSTECGTVIAQSMIVVVLIKKLRMQVSSVQLLSCVWLFVTPWTVACQTSLSITNFWSLLKLVSVELVMPVQIVCNCGHITLAWTWSKGAASIHMQVILFDQLANRTWST